MPECRRDERVARPRTMEVLMDRSGSGLGIHKQRVDLVREDVDIGNGAVARKEGIDLYGLHGQRISRGMSVASTVCWDDENRRRMVRRPSALALSRRGGGVIGFRRGARKSAQSEGSKRDGLVTVGELTSQERHSRGKRYPRRIEVGKIDRPQKYSLRSWLEAGESGGGITDMQAGKLTPFMHGESSEGCSPAQCVATAKNCAFLRNGCEGLCLLGNGLRDSEKFKDEGGAMRGKGEKWR
ncbi:hypothetical protein B0H17DRAFT_1141631 [Mycena rosella]|uniref:Uncharacterized protein n=1 Tax=Mycena rosella TaxID=1033263 RepID=A0AAD7G9Y8_MYCRO|nr:hypothetical protein B0H17DRAFT_1141631 [Mycena rosella]